eukprot:3410647-Rhodomonas_salina.4
MRKAQQISWSLSDACKHIDLDVTVRRPEVPERNNSEMGEVRQGAFCPEHYGFKVNGSSPRSLGATSTLGAAVTESPTVQAN